MSALRRICLSLVGLRSNATGVAGNKCKHRIPTCRADAKDADAVQLTRFPTLRAQFIGFTVKLFIDCA